MSGSCRACCAAMWAAAAAARPDDPGANTHDPAVREARYNLGADIFAGLCDAGYTHGDFSVANALRANHEWTKQLFERSMVRGTKTVDETEAYTMLQMSYTTNAFL